MIAFCAVLALALPVFSPAASAPSPSPQGPRRYTVTGEPAGEGLNGRCGTERWGVKTLSDSDASAVDLTGVVDTTVADLISNPPDSPWAAYEQPPKAGIMEFWTSLRNLVARGSFSRAVPDQRILSGDDSETQVYRVHGLLLEARRENDQDYHAVIADPNDPSKTMIVEFPDPTCPGARDSAAKDQIAQGRSEFEALFGAPPSYPGDFKPASPVAVVVSGVRFFDPIHGQTGVAPNGVELHPVLSIRLDSDGSQ